MAAETSSSSRSSSTSADSYIGSLISLTSKSEIRYEGILYNINTEESSIGLRNVRSFGTEGRKKDGQQVPPGDKIYEYILFRGSDIKDLQVKSSPPVQTTQSINSDPAIIQSHYTRPQSTSPSLPAAAAGSLPDLSPHTTQLGQPGSTFQAGLPLYQPGGNLGSWGPSPPPSANGGGLAMPMYWQGYYGPPGGIPPLHQQSLLRPPPGLPMPLSLQQPIQYPGFNASLPAGASSMQSSNLPEYPSVVSSTTSSLNMPTLPVSTLSSSLPPVPPSTLASDVLPNLASNMAPAIPGASIGTMLPSLPNSTSSTPSVIAVVPPSSNKPSATPTPSLSYQSVSQPIPTAIVPTTNSIQSETPSLSLVTPDQLLQSGPATVSSSNHLQMDHKDVEVVQVSAKPSSEPPALVPNEAQPPILPLPTPSHPAQKLNGASSQIRYNSRGRDRRSGVGSSRPVTTFTEDFDFMAMNEKFKKDEVWGHLGKSNKSHSKDKEGDGENSDEGDFPDEDDELPKFEVKPVYNKDDFFDSLSSNSVNNESHNGRRFSEQIKIDTETFGDYARYRGGRGGRGPYRGGRFRGSYHGRGYGYVGRGRGRGVSARYF